VDGDDGDDAGDGDDGDDDGGGDVDNDNDNDNLLRKHNIKHETQQQGHDSKVGTDSIQNE
jgi:hypothetical protein